MAESLLLAAAADLRRRVDCCQRGTPDGYGERASLRTVYRVACGTYHRYGRHELELEQRQRRHDAIVAELLAELDVLQVALREAREYLDGFDSQESRG